MKKILFFLCFIALSSSSFSNSLASFNQEKFEKLFLKPKKKVKVKFRHGGNQCQYPLGVCILITVGYGDDYGGDELGDEFYEDDFERYISEEEKKDDIGMTVVEIIDNKLHIEFFRPAALEDGTVPIEDDTVLDPALTEFLGYKSIKLKGGNYSVENIGGKKGKNNFFGEIFIDCELN